MCGLRVRFSQNPERRGVFDYALKVEVVLADGIPPKIFVYHQMPAGNDGNTFAEFDHVATPVDFQEIPEDAASATVTWFRTDKCVVWVRSIDDLKVAKQQFVDDIYALQRTFDVLSSEDNFTEQTTVDFTGEIPHLPVSKDDVDIIEAAIRDLDARKVDKNALAGSSLSVSNLDGVRNALVTCARILGASIVWPRE